MYTCVSAVRLERLETLHSLLKTPKLWGGERPNWSTDSHARRVIHSNLLVIEAAALETFPDLVWCVFPSGC